MNDRRKHKLADTAQQIIGGFLLAGPFVVTQEVWSLARNITPLHSVVLIGAVMTIGYGGLYGADNNRDPRREAAIVGVPVRFISVLLVAFGSVGALAVVLSALAVFLSDLATAHRASVTLRHYRRASVFTLSRPSSAVRLS